MTEQKSSSNASADRSASKQAELDIMARLGDPQWALAAAQLEDEAGCDISAGRDWGSRLGDVLNDPAKFYQHQRLRSYLLIVLNQLLSDCDLGAGLTSAQALAKRCLFRRLQKAPSDIQIQLAAVLSEKLEQESTDFSPSETTQVALQAVVKNVLTTDDWNSISAAAATAIQQHIKKRMALPKTA
ncbi:MAG: hypothetical protein AAFN40_04455 [Cyanobacteria bacterium J06560_6]